MKIAVLSLFPEMFDSFLSASILGRARTEGLLDVRPVDIRPYSDKKHKNTDDYPFGGGAGMVMMAQPIVDAVRDLRSQDYAGPCIYLSPRGTPLTQKKVVELSAKEGMILLCGHYEGVDQRAIDLVVDEEISLGDFVLTGGEVAAMALIDAVARYVPGVLGSGESTEEESPTACWNTCSIPVPACLRGGRCRRCCLAATMPRSAIGADGRRCWPRCVHGRICSPQHP